ncbi:MAG: S8 family serine peptidase [Candidatus Eiseniibacteriota bacterium]
MARWLLILIAACMVSTSGAAPAARAADCRPGELLLILADDTPLDLGASGEGAPTSSDPALSALLARHGLVHHEMIVRKSAPLSARERRYVKLTSDRADFDPIAAAAELTATGHFVAVSPNYQLELLVMPNDTYIGRQWAVESANDADIDLPEAWDVEQGHPGVVIAVIDTGVDWSHPDLAGNAWQNPGEIPSNGIDDDGNGYVDDVYGWDCAMNDNDPRPEPYLEAGVDVGFHGTHCAGIAAATTNNAAGIAGAGWGCSVMGLKVVSTAGGFTTQAVTNAFLYAATEHVDVISMSFGGTFQDFGFMQSLIDDATADGIVCVAAAGNNDTPEMLYPAALDHVLSVAATNASNQRASFSTYGTWVDVAAPGEHIWSCVQSNYEWDVLTQLLFMLLYEWDGVNPYMYADGTSMACPLTAGVCALVRGAAPWMTAEQVAERIIDTGDVIQFDQPIGVKVNALAAVTNLTTSATAAAPAPAVRLVSHPNPFNPRTTLELAVVTRSRVRLDIHDATGRLVRTLLDGVVPAGVHTVAWDGRDGTGRRAASGLYLARVTANGGARTLKLTLVR